MSSLEMYRSASVKSRVSDDTSKPAASGRVVAFNDQIVELRSIIDRMDAMMNKFKEDIQGLSTRLATQEQLDMTSFNDKHNRMKSNYNDFVTSYNVARNETQTIILDMTKRLNECESLLNIK